MTKKFSRWCGPIAALAAALPLAASAASSPKAAIKPAPNAAALAAKNTPFMFVAYGDTRSQPDAHRIVVKYLVSLHPEFALQTGDLVDNGASLAEWNEFDQITAPIRAAHIAYYPSRGNHDLGPYYIKHVTEKYDSGDGYYYAFTRHDIRFIALDNFEPLDPDSAQYQWLVGELKKARGKTIVAMLHEAPFSVGPHGSNFDVQKEFHPLFVKYHVALVFAGHDHLYYRTIRDGVTYIVTGGGGAPLYPATNTQYAIPGDVYKTTYHVVRCDVAPSTITLTALTPDGQQIDKLSVKR